jgi:hypothetical protein
MIYLAIIILLAAAVFGLIIASAIIRNQPTPKPMVYIHGLLGALALAIIIFYVLKNPDNNPMVSLVLLCIAAVGGFILFGRDMSKKPGPVSLVVIHALMAVSGVLGLILFVMQ